MNRLVVLRVAVLLAMAVVLTPMSAAARAAAQESGSTAVERCLVTDERLAELSGLAADDEFIYAVADGGRRLQVVVLRRDCAVQRLITAAVDPFDVEDLARSEDGRLWLADVGDNGRDRDTVALHVIGQQGAPRLYRLTYPDGQHDAEALLLDRDDRPYIVTKEPFGGAGVYRPAGALSDAGPTPLERVASVRLSRTDTPGGPTSSVGSMLVTGGATSIDGTVFALRTYTDAYLYSAPDGDVVAALGREPVRVPLPNEPQGEAIAFEPDGTLLTGSERADAGPQPIRAVADAFALLTPPPPAPSTTVPAESATSAAGAQPADEPGRGLLSNWQAALIAIVAAAGVIVVVSRVRRRGS